AAGYGAHAASRCRVVGFLREGERVTGVRVHDLEHDREFEVRAKQMINATGVWTDDTQALGGSRGQSKARASTGIHLWVPRGPLRSGDWGSAATRSREQTVASPVAGLVVVAGGKYTTYRVMAKDAVDAAAHGLATSVPPSCTETIPLAGAEGYQALWNARSTL